MSYHSINGNYVILGEILHLWTSDLNPFSYIVVDDVVGLTIFMYVFYLLYLWLKTFFNVVSPEQTRDLASKQ